MQQRIDKAESAKHANAFVSDADRFAQKVATKLEERESILQGKHTPGRAPSLERDVSPNWWLASASA
jgi:hypothetical protein